MTAPISRILVKMPNWVGDCIMATPALDYLRMAFPDAQIDAMARPSVASVLASNETLAEVISADDRKMPSEIARRLKGKRYDLAVILPNSLRAAWLMLKLGIPRRVGYARGGRSLILTCSVPYDARRWCTLTPKPLSKKSLPGERSASEPSHMVEYYLELAVAAARDVLDSAPAPSERESLKLSLPVVAESARQALELLTQEGLEGAKLAAINPGAAYGNAKRWPLDRLAAVADGLAARGYAIVSTASRFETDLNTELARHAQVRIHVLGEKLDLPGLAALLDRVDVFVTNDSGAMHMAAALGTPTAAIFGPTDWNVTYPWQKNAQVIRNSPDCAPCFLRECPIDHRCMTSISADEVTAQALRLAEAGRRIGS